MTSDSSLKCRTCLNESKKYKSVDDVEECYNILDMLDSIVPHIDIRSSTQYSSLVCQICVVKLLNSYKFQQMCIKSNNILQNILPITMIKDENDESITDPLANQNIKYEDAAKKLEEISFYQSPFSGNDNSSSSTSQAQFNMIELESRNCTKEDDTEQKTITNIQTFQCHYCPKTFEKQKSLAAHSRIHKKKKLPKNKTNECDLGESLVLSITLQEKEANDETDKEDIANGQQIRNEATNKPAETENKFNDSTDTGSGEIKTNTNERHFPCKLCGKTFDRPSNLRIHNNVVHSLVNPHECKTCKYRFRDEKSLEAHLLKHKKEAGLYKCDYCKKTFSLQKSLLRHIQNYHKSEESLHCLICERIFKNGHSLQQHMLVHKSYLCIHCGKTIKGQGNYSQHLRRHEGLQKYQCPDCPKRFNCKADIISHSRAHSNAKPHVCDICNTRFTRNSSMRKHKQLVHGGERPLKCDKCGMTFNRPHILKRHMLTHTGEKPYKCKYCECAFAHSGVLNTHLRRHLGEKTYICDQCPESFKYQVELRNHQSQHYKMDQKREQSIVEEAQHHEENMEKQQENDNLGQQ